MLALQNANRSGVGAGLIGAGRRSRGGALIGAGRRARGGALIGAGRMRTRAAPYRLSSVRAYNQTKRGPGGLRGGKVDGHRLKALFAKLRAAGPRIKEVFHKGSGALMKIGNIAGQFSPTLKRYAGMADPYLKTTHRLTSDDPAAMAGSAIRARYRRAPMGLRAGARSGLSHFMKWAQGGAMTRRRPAAPMYRGRAMIQPAIIGRATRARAMRGGAVANPYIAFLKAYSKKMRIPYGGAISMASQHPGGWAGLAAQHGMLPRMRAQIIRATPRIARAVRAVRGFRRQFA